MIHITGNREWTLLRAFNDNKRLTVVGYVQAIQARLEGLAAGGTGDGTFKQSFDEAYIGPCENRPKPERVANTMAKILKLET